MHQADAGRPRCPWCSVRLRPRRVLDGWEPGSRRRTHACLVCDGSWCVVADPTVLVTALVDYSRAARASVGEPMAAAAARLAELHLDAPV